MTFLLAASVSILVLIIGILCGRWLFPWGDELPHGDEAVGQHELDRILMAVGQTRAVTKRVARNVGHHSAAIGGFSAELSRLEKRTESGAAAVQVAALVSQVVSSNEKLQRKLASAEEKLKLQEAEIALHQAEARVDPLTGLFNRRAFEEGLERRMAEWQRKGGSLSVMLLDVDRFGQLNEVYGHQAGEELLREVARTLTEVTRQMDLQCRYGPDEFAVLLPATPLAGAATAVERTRTAIESLSIYWQHTPLPVTASFGAAQVVPGDDAISVLERAELALAASKEAGRNCGHIHEGQTAIPTKAAKAPAAGLQSPPVAETPPVRALASLPDAASFQEELARRVAESHRYGLPLSVICLKVADFDRLAADHGDDMAARVLDAVAERLKQTARDEDYLATDGEDGFALLLPRSSEAEAAQIARRIDLTHGSQVIRAGGRRVTFKLLVGHASCQNADDAESLRSRAKEALCLAPTAPEAVCPV